jgi:hypothetical protein
MPDEKKVKPVEDSKKEVVSDKTPSEIKKPVRRKKKPVALSKVKEKKPVTKSSAAKPIEKKEIITQDSEEKTQPVESAKVATETVVSTRPQPPREPSARRHRVDLAEIKPNIKYIAGLKGKRSIVGLTAYDAIMSKLVSKAGVDFILVGDSVGTTLLGYETTIPVTIDDMVHHTAAVRRGQPGCLVVADLPFGEASLSFDRLLDSARRLMQNGCRCSEN